MAKIKLIADSTCDLTKEMINELDIEIAPLMVNFEGDSKTYYDLVDLNVETLIDKVNETGVLPKTSSRSPEYHRELFQKYIDEGYEVIYVTISSSLSNTFNSGLLGKCDTTDPHKVQVIDSRNLSTSQGILLYKLSEMAKTEKYSAKELRIYAEEKIIPNLRCSFALQTVEYMAKGGRCSAISAFFSRILQMRPIISVVDGKLGLTKKPIGTIAKAINIIYDDMILDKDEVDTDYIFVTHCVNEELALTMAKKIEELGIFKHILVTECGSIIGSHCGPNCIGILYLKKAK